MFTEVKGLMKSQEISYRKFQIIMQLDIIYLAVVIYERDPIRMQNHVNQWNIKIIAKLNFALVESPRSRARTISEDAEKKDGEKITENNY